MYAQICVRAKVRGTSLPHMISLPMADSPFNLVDRRNHHLHKNERAGVGEWSSGGIPSVV